MVANLSHKDNHNRAIAAQILCNLAKSDPKNRILKDFDALLAVTKDERFVTARHCLQSLWKVGVAERNNRRILIEGLERRFKECITEKNCTLIRYDIIQSLRNVYDAVKDEKIKEKALELIETEEDLKYRKKYASLWRQVKCLEYKGPRPTTSAPGTSLHRYPQGGNMSRRYLLSIDSSGIRGIIPAVALVKLENTPASSP